MTLWQLRERIESKIQVGSIAVLIVIATIFGIIGFLIGRI